MLHWPINLFIAKVKNNSLLKYIYVLHTIYGELDKSYWKFHTSVMSISKFAGIPWHSSTSIIKFSILVIIWWQSARLASRAYRHLCSCIASPRNKIMFMFSHRTIIIRERLSEINRLRWSRHVERVGVTGKVSASLAPLVLPRNHHVGDPTAFRSRAVGWRIIGHVWNIEVGLVFWWW